MDFKSYDDFIKYLETCYFDNKRYKENKKKYDPYLNTLLENCPVRDEWSFNAWIFGEGHKYRTDNKSINVFVEGIVIGWINYLFRRSYENKN